MHAANCQIAEAMDRPIEQLVPPILKHSRNLQQSQEPLESRVWLGILPKLQDVDLVWDGEKKVE